MLAISRCRRNKGGTYGVEDDPNHQAAAGAARNILAVSHVENGNLKTVAAGTWVVVDLQRLVVETVLDFDFVVEIQLFVSHGF